jgi:hypothetical protein
LSVFPYVSPCFFLSWFHVIPIFNAFSFRHPCGLHSRGSFYSKP